jgi:hypothetical protein
VRLVDVKALGQEQHVRLRQHGLERLGELPNRWRFVCSGDVAELS